LTPSDGSYKERNRVAAAKYRLNKKSNNLLEVFKLQEAKNEKLKRTINLKKYLIGELRKFFCSQNIPCEYYQGNDP